MTQSKCGLPYVAVSDPYIDWQKREMDGYVPTDRQMVVIAAVRAAVEAKLFYTSDVLAFAKTYLAITEEQAAVGTDRVEGGNFGMDLYYARDFLRAEEAHALDRSARDRLKLCVGKQLGTLVFNDMKRNTGMRVTSTVDGKLFTLTGKRGASTVILSCSARQIEHAMVRAFERGQRKDNFDAFVSTVPSPPDLVLTAC